MGRGRVLNRPKIVKYYLKGPIKVFKIFLVS
jgi:hypothetical protein